MLTKQSQAGDRQSDQLVYSAAHRLCQKTHFSLIVIGRAEGIAKLAIREAREQPTNPLRVLNRDVPKEAAILPTVTEGYAVSLNLINES